MHLNILEQINYGYGALEPVVLGLMAMNKNFLLIGRHGAGKSRLAKVLSQGFGEKGFVFYDATKDDLISIAGIPNPDAIKEGRLTFTPHQRSIWDKSTIVVDEITRASRENQNLWLEILEERTCFGLPLVYRSLIATANPESYAAAFKLDEALLDRFHAVLPIPDLQRDMGIRELQQILDLAATRRGHLEAQTVARLFNEIQQAHQELAHGVSREKVNQYVASLIAEVLRDQSQADKPVYLSPRTYARNFPETLLATAAYFQVAGEAHPLDKGAEYAIRYALGTKYKIEDAYLMQLHRSLSKSLCGEVIPEGEKMRFAMAALSSFEERLAYLQDNRDSIKTHLKQDELEKFLGTLLQGASREGEKEKLVHLRSELELLNYQGDILRQVDGNLILTLNSAINEVMPLVTGLKTKAAGKTAAAHQQIQRFQAMVSAGTFISADDGESRKLQAFIIDIYEEDIEAGEERLLAFFGELNLPSED